MDGVTKALKDKYSFKVQNWPMDLMSKSTKLPFLCLSDAILQLTF